MKRTAAAILLLLLASEPMAGARGFTAVIVDIGGESFFESSVYTKSINGDFASTEELQHCWTHRATGTAGIAQLMRKKIPDGMTITLAHGVWMGEESSMRKMQAILRKAKSPDGWNEIDGIYILKAQTGEVSIMALGSRQPIGKNNPTKKITISWNEKNPSVGAAAFDLALCQASSPLDFGFSP